MVETPVTLGREAKRREGRGGGEKLSLVPWMSQQGAERPHLPEGQGDSEAFQRAV